MRIEDASGGYAGQVVVADVGVILYCNSLHCIALVSKIREIEGKKQGNRNVAVVRVLN